MPRQAGRGGRSSGAVGAFAPTPLLAAPQVVPAAPRLRRHTTDYMVPLSPNLSTVTFSASKVWRANFV